MPRIEDAPKARFMVVHTDAYEPSIRFYATVEAAKDDYTRTDGGGEEVFLCQILENK